MLLIVVYKFCVVNWKLLYMLLINKFRNILVWRVSLCYYCMNVDYLLIYYFFYWGGRKNKDIRLKKEYVI